jgi:hypothetical protein
MFRLAHPREGDGLGRTGPHGNIALLVSRVRAVGYAARLGVRPECGWGDSQGCYQEAIQERARRREGAVTKASGQSLRPLAPTARGDQVAQPLFTQRRGTEILRCPQHLSTPYIRRLSVAPSLATIYACSLLCNECGGADESRPSLLSAYLTLRRDGAASAADIVPGVRCRATGREQGREYGGASAGRLDK